VTGEIGLGGFDDSEYDAAESGGVSGANSTFLALSRSWERGGLGGTTIVGGTGGSRLPVGWACPWLKEFRLRASWPATAISLSPGKLAG